MARPTTWQQLFTQATIIAEHISAYTFQMNKKLSDFGLAETSGTRKTGTQGYWSVVGKHRLERMLALQSSIRSLVNDYSVPFPLVRGGKCVSNAVIMELKGKLDSLIADFNTEADYLVDNYEQFWAEQQPLIMTEVANVNPDCNPQIVLSRIEKQRVPKESLRSKFSVTYTLSAFSMPLNQEVAAAVANETEAVSQAISEMTNDLVVPIKNRIVEIIELVKKGSRSFTEKTINATLRDCAMYKQQNIFNDPTINQIIERLATLVASMDPKEKDQRAITNFTNNLEELSSTCRPNGLEQLFHG